MLCNHRPYPLLPDKGIESPLGVAGLQDSRTYYYFLICKLYLKADFFKACIQHFHNPNSTKVITIAALDYLLLFIYVQLLHLKWFNLPVYLLVRFSISGEKKKLLMWAPYLLWTRCQPGPFHTLTNAIPLTALWRSVTRFQGREMLREANRAAPAHTAVKSWRWHSTPAISKPVSFWHTRTPQGSGRC